MAKSTAVATTTTKAEVVTALGNADLSNAQDIASVLQSAKHVSTSELEMVSSEYVKLELGETYVFAVTGMCDIDDITTGDNKPDGAVCLITENGTPAINADIVFVSTVKRMKEKGQLPCMVKVYVEEKERGGKDNGYKGLQIWRF